MLGRLSRKSVLTKGGGSRFFVCAAASLGAILYQSLVGQRETHNKIYLYIDFHYSCVVYYEVCAGVAQSAEQLICNQQVAGSSPITSSGERFPSGQRGQTVNLLATPSEVRILPSPPE